MFLHLFCSDSRPQGAAGEVQGQPRPVQAPAPKDTRRCPQGLCGRSPASTWLSSAQFIDFFNLYLPNHLSAQGQKAPCVRKGKVKKFWQVQCRAHSPGGAVPVPDHPLGADPSPNTHPGPDAQGLIWTTSSNSSCSAHSSPRRQCGTQQTQLSPAGKPFLAFPDMRFARSQHGFLSPSPFLFSASHLLRDAEGC